MRMMAAGWSLRSGPHGQLNSRVITALPRTLNRKGGLAPLHLQEKAFRQLEAARYAELCTSGGEIADHAGNAFAVLQDDGGETCGCATVTTGAAVLVDWRAGDYAHRIRHGGLPYKLVDPYNLPLDGN